MPKYAHHTFEGGGIAIWHITESADTLYALLATDRYDEQLATKHHEARRAEWLAVRLLVKELFGADAEVAYYPTGKPYLKSNGDNDKCTSNSVMLATTRRKYLAECHAQDDGYSVESKNMHISISHTRGYAAVAYHHNRPIGVDIEYISNRVERIADRFTSTDEAAYIDTHDVYERQRCHLINWSAKETLYKLFDVPHMADFKNSFHIAPYRLDTNGVLCATVYGDKDEHCTGVAYRIFPYFVCTWAFLHCPPFKDAQH